MEAIVLNRRDFREYDQIVSLYTKEQGRQDYIAKGLKRITSKNAPHLEIGSVVDIGIAKGKELDWLTHVQGEEYFSAIRKNMAKSSVVMLVFSQLEYIFQIGEKDEFVYALLKGWLYHVVKQQDIRVLDVDILFFHLCIRLGFRPKCLDQECKDISWFHVPSGAVHASKKDLEHVLAFSPLACRVLQHMVESDFLQKDVDSITAKKIHEALLAFVRYHLERDIPDWSYTGENCTPLTR